MTTLRQRYRAANTYQRSYVWNYGWGVLWAVVYAALTPAQTTAVFLQPVIILYCLVLVASGSAAAWGVLTQDELVLERGALTIFRWVTLAYPLSQAIVLGLELHATGHTERWGLILLACWPWVFLGARARWLKLKACEARATPLPTEGDV